MSNKIDMKTLEALQQGCHKAFEVVFLAYYGKVKALYTGTSSPNRMPRSWQKIYL